MQAAGASAVSIPIKEAGEKLADLSASANNDDKVNLKIQKPGDES